jgi:hypothetical protein
MSFIIISSWVIPTPYVENKADLEDEGNNNRRARERDLILEPIGEPIVELTDNVLRSAVVGLSVVCRKRQR